MEKHTSRISWQGTEIMEKAAKNNAAFRKSQSMLTKKTGSFDSSGDRISADEGSHPSTNNNSNCNQGAMKPNSSVADFRTREGLTIAKLKSEEDEIAENSKISQKFDTSGTESNAKHTELTHFNSWPDNKNIRKAADRDENNDALNATHSSTKHRIEKFQKIFPDIAAAKELLQYYYCAYSRDILYPGFIYVTQDWICFHSKIMGKKSIRISVESIVDIVKTKTAKFIPNAIGIITLSEKHVFGSLVSRDRTYSLLIKLWRKRRNQREEDSLMSERPKPEDDSTSTEENLSGSDESPICENSELRTSRSRISEVLTGRGESAEVLATVRRQPGNISPDGFSNHKSTQGGTTSEYSSNCRQRWYHGLRSKIHKLSTTSIMLSLTAIIIVFLIMSACLLAYKLVHLQAQMEVGLIPHISTTISKSEQQDRISEDVYYLKHEEHLSMIQRLHKLLDVQLNLLEKIRDTMHGFLDMIFKW